MADCPGSTGHPGLLRAERHSCPGVRLGVRRGGAGAAAFGRAQERKARAFPAKPLKEIAQRTGWP